MKYFKFLLLPITLMLFYCLTYYGIYFSLLGFVFLYSLSWIWLILGFSLIFKLLTIVISEIPALIRILIFKIYNYNKVIVILHTITGFIGLLAILYFFYLNPIESSHENSGFLKSIWNESPFKTIVIGIAYLAFIISFLISSLVLPIFGDYILDEN